MNLTTKHLFPHSAADVARALGISVGYASVKLANLATPIEWTYIGGAKHYTIEAKERVAASLKHRRAAPVVGKTIPLKVELVTRNGFAVEKGIPVPSARKDGMYPWSLMEVGDSFFVPEATIKTISPLASSHGKRHTTLYKCRTLDGGVRVWRVA